jgi:hypothetical protein
MQLRLVRAKYIVGTNAIGLALRIVALNLPNLRMPCQTTPHRCFLLRAIPNRQGSARISVSISESI